MFDRPPFNKAHRKLQSLRRLRHRQRRGNGNVERAFGRHGRRSSLKKFVVAAIAAVADPHFNRLTPDRKKVVTNSSTSIGFVVGMAYRRGSGRLPIADQWRGPQNRVAAPDAARHTDYLR